MEPLFLSKPTDEEPGISQQIEDKYLNQTDLS